MSLTPYSGSNQIFSDLAHEAAEQQVYPFIFDRHQSDLQFQNTGLMSGGDGKILDGKMGIDWCVSVSSERLKFPIEHTIQERFRKIAFMHNRDLTITEHNQTSNQPGELHKIKAGIFVYGYYEDASNTVREWVAADTTIMLIGIHSGKMRFTRSLNPRSQQTFISIKFRELYEQGALLAYKQDGKQPIACQSNKGTSL